MEINLYEAIAENYAHAVRRGKIREETTEGEMLFDIQKELAELLSAKEQGDLSYFNSRLNQIASSQKNGLIQGVSDDLYASKYKEIMAGTKTDEAIDLILVLFSYCYRSGIDVERGLMAKIKYNQLRDRQQKKEPSCLEYLLDIFNTGKRFDIYYNSDHCIGISGTGIYEKDSNAFKKSIENGEKIKYFELSTNFPYESIINSFGLSTSYQTTLKKYYERKRTEKK